MRLAFHCLIRMLASLAVLVCCSCVQYQQPAFHDPDETLPVPYETRLSETLRCLGGLIDQYYYGKPVMLSILPTKDGTRPDNAYQSMVSQAGDYMISGAIAKLNSQKVIHCMSRTQCLNDAYLDNEGLDVILVNSAVSEYDFTASNPGQGAGIAIGDFDFSFGKDRTWDSIAVDVNLIRFGTGEVLDHGSFRSQLFDESIQGEIEIEGKIAFHYAFEQKKLLKRHAHQRTLLETGLYHLLARYFEIDQKPALKVCNQKLIVQRQADQAYLHAFQQMDETQRITTIQELLKHYGFYFGELDGQLGSRTQAAIKAWASAMNISLKQGFIHEEIYLSLKQLEPNPVRNF